MLQLLRINPGLIINLALLGGGVVVCALVGFIMTRSGASLRPICWFAGLFLLIALPQFIGHLWFAIGAAKQEMPRVAALEQISSAPDIEVRHAAAKLLFGPDADPQLVTDARRIFGDALEKAELAHFAALPNGESVLLARFKGYLDAEKAWFYYLRNTGLNQLGGKGDSQRGYSVSRPAGDRAYALHLDNMVGVWTGVDDTAIRNRMLAGGFKIPRRAPLAVAAGILPAVEGGILPPVKSTTTNQHSQTAAAATTNPIGVAFIASAFAVYLIVVALFFFKGAAWASSSTPKPGISPVTAAELATRLEAINDLDVPFRIERGQKPDEFFATWRYADAKWIDLARLRGMNHTFRIRLTLDENSGAVRATDYAAQYDWSAGRGGADVVWKSSTGIVFFQHEHKRVFGLQLDDQGRFKPELSYAYTFKLQEMKSPLIEAVTRAGWNWRPTIWQGPAWLRWLTE
jgi:hypothetical protein